MDSSSENKNENFIEYNSGSNISPGSKMTGAALLAFVLLTIVFIMFIVMILEIAWNSSVPNIFPGVNKLNFVSALGLLIVAMILFPKR